MKKMGIWLFVFFLNIIPVGVKAQDLGVPKPKSSCLVADILFVTDWSESIGGSEKFLVMQFFIM